MEVRNKMDQKVLEMRGQTMTFSNDGVELSLNVPDTGDVKRVFGTMIDTVVEQHEEIVDLNTNLDNTVKENRAARQKIVSATTDRLQQLLAHQLKLEQQLMDAQKSIQNFAYNIQGYVDEHESEPAPTEAVMKSHVTIARNLTLDIGQDDNVPDDSSVRSGPVTLFPTEDGASPTKLANNNNNSMSALPMFHPETAGKKEKKKKSLLSSGTDIDYHSIPTYTMPVNNIAGKWRWAIKKVMQDIRRKKLKIGFTRTRIEKKQTIAGRLDAIDRDLFVIPQELTQHFQQKLSQLSAETQQNLAQLRDEHVNYANATNARIDATDAKVADIADRINSHDERITKLIDAIAQKEEDDIRVVTEQILVLRGQLRLSVTSVLTQRGQKLDKLTSTVGEIDVAARQLMREIKNTTVLSENPPEDKNVELLTQLLDRDKNVSHLFHRMGQLESQLHPVAQALHETHEAIGDMASKYLQTTDVSHVQYPFLLESDLQQLDNLSNRAKQQTTESSNALKSIRDSLSIMSGMLNRHDELLREVAHVVLGESVSMMDMLPGLQTQLTSALAKNTALADSVKQLNNEKTALAEQVSGLQKEQSVTSSAVENMSKLLAGQDLGQVTSSLDNMQGQMDGFKNAVAQMQAQMMTLFQTVMMQAQLGNMVNNNGGTKSIRQSVAANNMNNGGTMSMRASMLLPAGQPTPPIPKEINAGSAAATTTVVPSVAAEEEASEQNNVDTNREGGGGEENSAVRENGEENGGGDNSFEGNFVDAEGGGGGDNSMDMMQQMMMMMSSGQSAGGAASSGNSSTTNMVSPSMILPPGLMMMGGGGGGGGDMMSEERVEDIVHRILESMDMNNTGNANNMSSPTRISSAGKKTSRQVSMNLASPSESGGDANSPSSPLRQANNKRQASGLMGSFADYNARKSLARMSGSGNGNNNSNPWLSGGSGNNNNNGGSLIGEHGFDPAPLLADIANIRAEASSLQKQLDALNDAKTTKTDVEKVCLDIVREYRKREARTDYRTMLEDMDVSMRELVHEVIIVKKETERIEHELRKSFEEELNAAILDTKKEMLDSSKEAVLSTKGLCLGCGRSSQVKMESTSRPLSPSFLPSLNANMIPGPDILRGGFKLPGRTLSPPTGYPEIPLLMKHRVQTAPAQAAEAAYQSRKSYFSQSTDARFQQQQFDQQQQDALQPVVSSVSPSRQPSASSQHPQQSLRVGFADDEPDSLLLMASSSASGLVHGHGNNANSNSNNNNNSTANRLVGGSFAEGSESLTVTMPAIPLSQLMPTDESVEFASSLDHTGPATSLGGSVSGPTTINAAAYLQQHASSPTSNLHTNNTNNNLHQGSLVHRPTSTVQVNNAGGSIIRPNVSTSDAETLRPMYRKGFPAKKSLKAEVMYAPERFDLGVKSLGGSSLLSASSTVTGGGLGVLHGAGGALGNANSSEKTRPSTVSAMLSAAREKDFQHNVSGGHIGKNNAVQSRSTANL